MENVLVAFGLTLFAGISTGFGSLIAFFAKKTNYRFLAISTGFSAGVMLYISFAELFPEAGRILGETYGGKTGEWLNIAGFFGGIGLIALIDLLIPSAENPHERPSDSERDTLRQDPYGKHPDSESKEFHAPEKLLRIGLFTALAVTIHNFPEGLATFVAALHNPSTGVAIAFAVALHNIPEGISVAVPIYYATGSRRKALWYSFFSGLAEPIGAGFAYLLLRLFLPEGSPIPEALMAGTFSIIAGIMVYISLDELIPASHTYGEGHDSIIGLIAGMAVMAVSLVVL
jgi:ZIP family zinc transporter